VLGPVAATAPAHHCRGDHALPQPHPTPKTRTTDFSRRVWRVTAQITEFKIEGDSDIHLVLFDGGVWPALKHAISIPPTRPALLRRPA
jgi:hypothetical protein